MTVLITGGYGHIGSWAAYLMARAGEKVFVIDVNPLAPDCLCEGYGDITFIKGDVMDFPRLIQIFQQYGDEIDGIIHTVAVMGGDVSQNPHQNVTLNIGGLLNMLEIARLFNIKKVLYTGTGAVYGAAKGIPSEDNTPPKPADLYGATKISGEYIGMQYGNCFDIDFRVCRLYWIYGPGRYPSELPSLDRAVFGALEGIEGINLEKGADQEFDFTDVEDAARGIELLYNATDLKYKIFNIATGESHSVGEVVELAQQYSHFPVPVKIGPGTLVPRAKALDIGRATEELGYKPKYSIEEGVKRYADWLGKKCGST
jgi:nucleoside-diphosphate-sugar epimerase